MLLHLRPPSDVDWPAIHAVANEAVPDAPDGNDGWLSARRAFDEASRTRRHYVAEHGEGLIVAYGGVEESGDAGWYRLFLVMRPDRLADDTGDTLFEALNRELASLGARVAWMREQAGDPVLAFALGHGFMETRRYTLGDEHSAYAGVEVVEMQRRLSH
jgi:hypothetical protein